MQRVVALMLAALAAAAGVSSYLEQAQVQQRGWLQAAGDAGTAFAIPPDQSLADPATAYSVLRAAAREARVNVFRTAVEYGGDGRPEVVLYALLEAPTRVADAFPLASGRWLTADDGEHPERLLSSADTGSPDQVGRLAGFGGADAVSVRALALAFDSLPVAGSYVAEAGSGASVRDFLRLLSEGASTAAGAAGAFKPSDFAAQGTHFSGVQAAPGPLLLGAQIAIVLATALLIAFGILHRAKAAGVMRLHGLGGLAIWYRLTGRLIVTVGLLAVATATVASRLVHDTTLAFTAGVALAIARAFAVMLGASIAASTALLFGRVGASLKNRKPTRALFALNALVKAALTLALIAAGAGLSLQYGAAAQERARLAGWDAAHGYAIFYPVSNGNDEIDMASGQEAYTPAVAESLYPDLDERGALYVDATQYEPAALASALPQGTYRSITVNVNYLRRFPVMDADGRAIAVDESTTDWVVLAPERLRGEASAISAWFRLAQGSAVAAEDAFGGEVPAAVARQAVSIRWVADGQRVFSFDPAVSPDDGNRISEPIVQVMTRANSVGMDRANAVSGGAGAALKVPVGEGGTAAALSSLQPVLQGLRLDDNLRHLVTLDGYAALEVARIEDVMRAAALAAGVLLMGLLYLAAASVAILFEQYSRRVVVRRLHGTGFLRRYREPVAIFSVLWAAQLLGALALNRIGANPFSAGATRPADDLAVVVVALIVALAEAAMSAAVLISIERRSVARVLKEEF